MYKCRKTTENLPKSSVIEQTLLVSSSDNKLKTTEVSPLSTEKVLQVTYPKGELKTVKIAMKRKTIHLTDSSNGSGLGDVEIIAQLKEK